MGCMNSKSITTRSTSIREDLNNRLHKTSAVFEELLTSHSGKSKLIAAFVRTSSTTTTIKRAASKKTSDSRSPEEPEKAAADPIDLIQEEIERTRESLTRSKSCNNSSREADLRDEKNLMGSGSRSFHTVEEFDALMERIHRRNSSKERSFQTNLKEDPQNLEVSGSLRNWVRIEETVREKGWKRKAVAERIKSLEVSTVEFPVIEEVKHSKNVQELDYYHQVQDTPKFGEYNNKSKKKTTYGEEVPNCEFCPELLAAFEDCMREIEEEEESILSDMGNLVIEEVPVII